METRIIYTLVDLSFGHREEIADTESYKEALKLQREYEDQNEGCETKIETAVIKIRSVKEEQRDLRAEKAQEMRYKKSALQEMSYYAIRRGLEEITEACYDVDWLFDSGNEDAIYEVLEETYEDFDEFRNAFLTVRLDAERLWDETEEILRYYDEDDFEQYFNDCTVALIGNRYQLMGYDTVETDYFNLSQYDSELAVSEAGKRLMKFKKADIISRIGQCMGILLAYYDLRQQYDCLKTTLDLLRGENVSVIHLVRNIEEAYEKANSEKFDEYSKETKEFDKLVSQLPEKVWIS